MNHAIRISKRSYKHDSKMIWKTLNEILNTPRKHKALPNEFLDINNSNNNIKDPFEIANTFNNYFVNIGPKLLRRELINHLTVTLINI